jgi:DNA-binding GntR family transcriptional regulator
MAQRRSTVRQFNRPGAARRTRRLAGALKATRASASGSAQERDTLQVRVYRALARGLMAGMFKPGEAVTLRTLAQRLGTSAMPVREAVSRLIAERALVLLPNRSVIVPRMSRARFTELTQTRQILEGMVTEAACARATPALLRELSTTNDAMKRCLADDDVRGALAHNMTFHFVLYRAAGKPVVLPLIEMLWLQAGPFLALSLTTPGMRWTARHHQALLAAMRASQGPSARRAIEADIEETSLQLLKKAIFEDAADAASLHNHLTLVTP